MSEVEYQAGWQALKSPWIIVSLLVTRSCWKFKVHLRGQEEFGGRYTLIMLVGAPLRLVWIPFISRMLWIGG